MSNNRTLRQENSSCSCRADRLCNVHRKQELSDLVLRTFDNLQEMSTRRLKQSDITNVFVHWLLCRVGENLTNAVVRYRGCMLYWQLFQVCEMYPTHSILWLPMPLKSIYCTYCREDSKPEFKKMLFCWLIINKPQLNLYSGDTFIQGTLALVPRVSPEWKFHCRHKWMIM